MEETSSSQWLLAPSPTPSEQTLVNVEDDNFLLVLRWCELNHLGEASPSDRLGIFSKNAAILYGIQMIFPKWNDEDFEQIVTNTITLHNKYYLNPPGE